MSEKKRKGREAEKARLRRRLRPRIVWLIVVALVLAAGSGVTAWRTVRLRPPSPPLLQSGGLSPGSPAKEYIYAGGRLISTEEPVGVSLPAPTSLIATAVSGAQVTVTWSWSAPPGVTLDHYELQRSQSITGPFIPVGPNPTTTSFTDTSVSNSVCYLYQVRAVSTQGGASTFSNKDLATTMSYTDSQVTGVTIKAQHINELRTAVNAIRLTANLLPSSWTRPSLTGQLISAVDINELRSGLNPALTAMGFSAASFADSTLVQGATIVKAAHVEQIRAATR